MRRISVCGFAALSLWLAGGNCGGGDGSEGDPTVASVESPDSRCISLPDPFGFPPGFDFLPDRPGHALAATFARPTLVPLDLRRTPFKLSSGAEPTELPSDADGDGVPERVQAIDDVFVESRDRAWVTLSGYEAVLAVDPEGGLLEIEVSVPEVFDGSEFRQLPAPGSTETRTGIANFTCIVPGPDARDSAGTPLADAIDPSAFCRPGVPSFRANFTSGVAFAAGRMFVSVSNLGARRGEADTQYLPAALTVYDVKQFGSGRLRLSPAVSATGDPTPSVLLRAGAFNATHVQRYESPSGREWVLVTTTGAIGIIEDDPDTDALESGATRLGDGSIEVVDPVGLRVVATIPLRDGNPAFGGLAIDPTGRLGLVGDVTARRLYAVDLAPLDSLDPSAPGVRVLGESVIFDGVTRFRLPRLPGSPPKATCPGRVDSVAFNHAGDRAFALEVCDGSLTSLEVEFEADAGVPLPDATLSVGEALALVAPLSVDTLGLTRQPSELRVRPGVPGVDFEGPDVFFLVGDPEGLLCGIRIESP